MNIHSGQNPLAVVPLVVSGESRVVNRIPRTTHPLASSTEAGASLNRAASLQTVQEQQIP